MSVPAHIDVRHLGRPEVIGVWKVDDVLVDPGPSVSLPTLLDALGDWVPSRILLTHIHLDHAGGTGTLAARWPDVEVWVHERGAPHLIDPSKLLSSAQRIYGDEMDTLWGEILPVPEDRMRILSGGESIEGFDVAYTPGHASHHVAYRHERTGWAFTGDVAGIRIDPHDFILPPTPPPDIDVELWHGSIDQLQAWAPTALAPTHFGPSANAADHLERLHEALTGWAELARHVDGDVFAGAVRAAEASALPLAVRDALEQGMAAANMWPGLHRYWSKRG